MTSQQLGRKLEMEERDFSPLLPLIDECQIDNEEMKAGCSVSFLNYSMQPHLFH